MSNQSAFFSSSFLADCCIWVLEAGWIALDPFGMASTTELTEEELEELLGGAAKTEMASRPKRAKALFLNSKIIIFDSPYKFCIVVHCFLTGPRTLFRKTYTIGLICMIQGCVFAILNEIS
jgi:hypothetical protein